MRKRDTGSRTGPCLVRPDVLWPAGPQLARTHAGAEASREDRSWSRGGRQHGTVALSAGQGAAHFEGCGPGAAVIPPRILGVLVGLLPPPPATVVTISSPTAEGDPDMGGRDLLAVAW